MNLSEWEKVKRLMLPYDGGASQIHLLSLQKTDIGKTIEVIIKTVVNAMVTVISSESLSNHIVLAEFARNEVEIKKFLLGQSTISAKIFETSDITFDIWAEEKLATFDLEVWFWADQFFLDRDEQNLKRFNTLLSILSSIAKGGSHRCILTPCEASDPLEDLKMGYGVEIIL